MEHMLQYALIAVLVIVLVYAVYYMMQKQKASKNIGGSCKQDSDCPKGHVCMHNLCVKGAACKDDKDCKSGQKCSSGFCQ